MSDLAAGPKEQGHVTTHRTACGTLPTLKKRAEFLTVAKGSRRHCGAFSVQAANAALGMPRIGYTVTKAVGNAPERNRIRRRLRAAVRKLANNAVNADFVIIGRRDLLKLDFRALTGHLADAMSRTAGQIARPAPAGAPKAQD